MSDSKIIKKEIKYAGRTLSFEYGELAGQASGAVLARWGDSVVLAAVTFADPREDIDYFPLYVEYVERLYAGGRIKGSRFVKREGRPSDEAILSGRVIDRSIRPLFPKDLKNEVQVVVTILSADMENDPTVLGLLAASCALAISEIPWNGPVGAARVGFKEGSFILNPSLSELEHSDLDLVVSGTKDAIVMVEAEADQLEEEHILGAIEFGFNELQSVVECIEGMAKEVGKSKFELPQQDEEAEKLEEDVAKFALQKVKEIVHKTSGDISTRAEYKEKMASLEEAVLKEFEGKYKQSKMTAILSSLVKDAVRELILKDGKRPDGRGFDEVRPLSIKTGVLPRTHGSAIFQRGETQVLTITTLGSLSLEQIIEGPLGEETKRYMHHYYFPPFSTGEVGRMIGPGRREIGHSALAERALEPVVPSQDEFPYAIRLVSEVLSSNGSTSMAATCGSSLSLMDAGVPIKAPVSGVAMGLYKGDKTYRILTDITGQEDQTGDMDFKVAGTEKGVTAVQMDIKVKGLTHDILTEAMDQARKARLHILEAMLKVIGKAREELSQYAPKVVSLKIDPSKIGEVIGPGGRIIKGITEKTGTIVDVRDDGSVYISGTEKANVEEAKRIVESLTHEVKVGEEFTGNVKRILDFGAFVEILPGKEGLVHVSELSHDYVDKVTDVLNVGDEVKVKVIGIDEQGRINLSKKALEPGGSGGGGRGRGGGGRSPSGASDRPYWDDGSGGQGGSRGGPPRRSGGPGYRTPNYKRQREMYRSPYRRGNR